METLEKLKKDKRSLKSSLTKYLNELAVELLLEAPKKERITERLQDIEKRRDELLELLENLRALYKEKSETTNAASIEEEANGIVDRVDSETSGARLFLAKGVAKTSDGNSKAENKSRKLESTCAKDGHMVDPNKQLERIRIPNFSGDKMKYSTWWAAFSSCVDAKRSQSIKIDIGNQSIHSISIDINRRLLSIDIGNRSKSNSQKKSLSIFIDWQKSITIDNYR